MGFRLGESHGHRVPSSGVTEPATGARTIGSRRPAGRGRAAPSHPNGDNGG